MRSFQRESRGERGEGKGKGNVIGKGKAEVRGVSERRERRAEARTHGRVFIWH